MVAERAGSSWPFFFVQSAPHDPPSLYRIEPLKKDMLILPKPFAG